MGAGIPKEVGGWVFTHPENVIKLGVVIDAYKVEQLSLLWQTAEAHAKRQLPQFNAAHFFLEERAEKGELIYSFRYYTPPSNRQRIQEFNQENLS